MEVPIGVVRSGGRDVRVVSGDDDDGRNVGLQRGGVK